MCARINGYCRDVDEHDILIYFRNLNKGIRLFSFTFFQHHVQKIRV